MTTTIKTLRPLVGALACLSLLAGSGCASHKKMDAVADVAVSNETVKQAAQAEATRYASSEMQAARDKLAQANQDYKLASSLSKETEADATLAHDRANSAQAKNAANSLKERIQMLRRELERSQH